MAARAVDTIVRGGKVVTATEVLDTSVAIQGGRIVALGHDEALPPAEQTALARDMAAEEAKIRPMILRLVGLPARAA